MKLELSNSRKKIEKLLSVGNQIAFIKANQIHASHATYEIPPDTFVFTHQNNVYINIDNYIYTIPFVQNQNERFLKTIIPSRKFTKKYLGGMK